MKYVKAIAWTPILFLLITGAGMCQDQKEAADPSTGSMSDSLNQLIRLADSTWDSSDTASLKGMSTEGSYPVQALAAALLFRADPKMYFDQFVELYAIHDYKERAEGEENLSSQAKMLEEFNQIQADHPDITDSRLKVLLMYEHVRKANIWVEIREEKVSMSRFFRATFLGDLFKGSRLDIEKVQAAIDENTRAKDLKDP